MAEQEYPVEQMQFSTVAANDEFHGLDSDTDILSTIARLEARFLDSNLLAANDADFAGTANGYPVDAFFQACQRHLRHGPSASALQNPEEFNGESALIQDSPTYSAEPVTTRPGAAKGPSYAL